jgi:hypothetical protein
MADPAPAGSSCETGAPANLVRAAKKLPPPPLQASLAAQPDGCLVGQRRLHRIQGADKSAAISGAIPPSHMIRQSPGRGPESASRGRTRQTSDA